MLRAKVEYEGIVMSDIMISPNDYLFFPVFIEGEGYVRLQAIEFSKLEIQLKKGDRVCIKFTNAYPIYGFNGWEFVKILGDKF